MSDILGAKQQFDGAVHGNRHGGKDDVVLAGGIVRIQSQRVARGIIDELRRGSSKLAVRSRVADVPCKGMTSRQFDLLPTTLRCSLSKQVFQNPVLK